MKSNPDNLSISEKQFPVVGIGASAGGLEAFKLFLKSIPENSGMAYVYVQHLSPEHESFLPEIFQKFTKIPVQLIADNIYLEPNHVYIIPPDRMLTTMDNVLKLEPIKNRKIKTIDLFFSSLGVVHQSFAVGVILSGSLNDGTLGLQVIKSYGGLTFSQDEASAAFDSMPKSAIRSGSVDFILPADKIVPKLIAINNPFSPSYTKTEIKQKGPQVDEDIFKQLLTVIRVKRGVDFVNYKQSTIKRRMVRRMALNKIEKLPEYLNFLRENKNEQDALYNDMLISVTNFFRDPKSFNYICNKIFPDLLHGKAPNESLRIWVAGCATGEEAYSMAICILEYLGDKASARKIQIFATDISEVAIAKARSGIYSQSDLEGLSSQQVEQFFSKLDGKYQVNKSIRDMCVFAHHNLLKDPPFSKLDLISCRNVMIYLEPVLQKRAFDTFHYALNEKGYLVLGKSEAIGASANLFDTINPHEKIYRSKGSHRRLRNIDSLRNEQILTEIDQHIQDKSGEKDIYKIADTILLSKYAGVMVNQAYEIIQFRGKTEPWLVQPSGKPSFNVLKMAREGLSFEIRSLLNLAKTKKSPASKEGINFKVNDQQQYVNIEVTLLPDAAEDFYLILFQNSVPTGESLIPKSNEGDSVYTKEVVNAWLQRIEQLEKELTQTREDMRAITEVQEAANEELQSANEELLSGSEELQSVNEELEASKEELQSTNEEIIIVNTELLDRNEQLNYSRRYTEEIFNTIHDPLLILDQDLKVIRATEGFYQLFSVREKDTEGKFLYNLGNGQWNIPLLRKQLENVLPKTGSFKSLEVDHLFNTLGRRVMKLTANQFENHAHEKLILLAIHDVTDKRKVEEGLIEARRLLEESKERLHFAIESADIGTWDYNPVTGELVWDSRCRALFGLDKNDEVNYSVFLERVHPEDRAITDEAIQQTLNRKITDKFNIEFRVAVAKDQKVRWIKSKGKAYFDKKKNVTRFIGTVLDISVEKSIEEHIKELLRKKDEFIGIASHELKTPITSLKAIVQILVKYVSKEENLKVHNLAWKAIKQVDKLSNLIADLLDVTKIQAGQLELNKTNFSIIKLIEECCEQIPDKPEGLKINIEGSKEINVYADKNRIEQVLMNLINNAIKYAPHSNSMKIEVSKNGNTVKTIVKDFGIGIDKDKISHIFERFFRIEETSRSFTGLGLGLFISAEIIRRHEGKIGVDSEPGKGSSFWFTLPDKRKEIS